MTIYLRWLSDTMLVRSALAGNRDAFGVLVDRHLGTVHALAWSHTGSPVDADDVTQETFLRAFTKLDTLREADKFAAWLTGIARNLAADARARALRTAPVSPELLDALPAPAAQPDEEEIYAVVRDAVLALEPPAREVLSLHYFAQKPMKEVAAIQGVSAEAAFKRLQRAREALGKELLSRIEHAPSFQARTKSRKNAILAVIATTPFAWKAAAATGGVSLGALGVGAAVVIVAALGSAGYGYRDVLSRALGIAVVEVPPVPLAAQVPDAEAAAIVPAVDAEVVTAPTPKAPIGRFHGHTYDMNSKPMAGVLVRAEMVHWEPDSVAPVATFVRETVSDENGAFELTGLKFGDYGLYSVGNSTMDAGSEYLSAEDPDKQVDAYLKPALPISGHVVNAAGVAVPGAVVMPFEYEPMGEIGGNVAAVAARMVCDSEGRFSGRTFWPGLWRLRAIAAGYGPTTSDYFEAGSKNNQIVLEAGGTVRGVVLGQSNQQPMAGVIVELQPDNASARMKPTDAEGRFEFRDVLAGIMSLALKCDGAVVVSGGENFTLGVGETHEATLVAGGGGTISGRVFDQDAKEGIPEVRVMVEGDTTVYRECVTDAQGGFFQTALPEDIYSIHVSESKGYLQVRNSGGRVHLSGVHEIDVQVPMRRGIPIQGHVVDADGEPAANVGVSAHYADGSGDADGASNKDGSFLLTVSPGTTRVDLVARDTHRRSEVQNGIFLPAAGLSNIEIKLSVLGSATIEVEVDLKGLEAAITAQSLELRLASSTPGGTSLEQPLTHLGKFSFDKVLPGRYQVELAGRDQFGSATVASSPKFDVAAGQQIKGVRLAVKGEGDYSIRGVVVDEQNVPVAGALVDVRLLGPGSAGPMDSDAEGRFTFSKLPDVEGMLSADKEGYFTATSTVHAQSSETWAQGAEETKLVLRRSGLVYLHLVNAESGESAGSEVNLASYPVAMATTDRSEIYTLLKRPSQMMSYSGGVDGRCGVSLKPGESFCIVSAAGYFPEGRVVSTEHEEEYLFLLKPFEGVTGTVRTAEGAPISGATLCMQLPGISHWVRSYDPSSTTSDINGAFTLKAAGPGTWFFVTHPGYAMQRVLAPEENPVEILLSVGGSIEGNVSTVPMPEQFYYLECFAELADGSTQRIDAFKLQGDGSFEIEHVPAGVAHLNMQVVPKDAPFSIAQQGPSYTALLTVRQDVAVRDGQNSRATLNPADGEAPPEPRGDDGAADDADAPTP